MVFTLNLVSKKKVIYTDSSTEYFFQNIHKCSAMPPYLSSYAQTDAQTPGRKIGSRIREVAILASNSGLNLAEVDISSFNQTVGSPRWPACINSGLTLL